MRILIADDDAQVRSALRLLLEHEPGLTVAGEADSVPRLLAQVRAVLPDLVLLDWRLPGMDAAAVVPALRALRPGLLVAALDGLSEKGPGADRWADTVVSKLDAPERVLAALGTCRPHACLPARYPLCYNSPGSFSARLGRSDRSDAYGEYER